MIAQPAQTMMQRPISRVQRGQSPAVWSRDALVLRPIAVECLSARTREDMRSPKVETAAVANT